MSQTTYAILSAIGTDRPGLVHEVSEYVFQHGGNIEDSRMVNLRGQFSMMVLIAADGESLAAIRNGLGGLAQKSRLHVELRGASEGAAAGGAASAQAIPYRITATSIDQPGLVHRIAQLLRGLNVNIESLDTHLAAAPYTGSPMFEMELIVAVPGGTSVAGMREKLGKLCDELNVDWEMEAE